MCNYSYNPALPASANPAALQGLTQDLYVWPCHLYVMLNAYSSLRRVSDAACHAPPQPHLNPPSLPEGPHLNKNARNKFEYVWHSYLVAYGDQQNCLLSVGILFFFFFTFTNPVSCWWVLNYVWILLQHVNIPKCESRRCSWSTCWFVFIHFPFP